ARRGANVSLRASPRSPAPLQRRPSGHLTLSCPPLRADPRVESMQVAAQLQPADIELTVLMPCLDEANTVGTCVRKAIEACRSAGIEAEVLIADNGSRDGSPELARAAGARVLHVEEKGYGAALRAGILASRERDGDSRGAGEAAHRRGPDQPETGRTRPAPAPAHLARRVAASPLHAAVQPVVAVRRARARRDRAWRGPHSRRRVHPGRDLRPY